MVVDIRKVVNCTNFGDHRFRGFRVAGGQISPIPVDFDSRPYNTFALPCECAICTQQSRIVVLIKTRSQHTNSVQWLRASALLIHFMPIG